MGWQQSANCVNISPESFYVDEKHLKAVEEAKQVCLGCVVKADCLRESLENYEEGIWGGLTETERIEYRATSYLRVRRQDISLQRIQREQERPDCASPLFLFDITGWTIHSLQA